MYYKLSLLMIVLLLLVFSGCEDDTTEPDTMAPTVFITFPVDHSTVYGIAKITCMATDNDGIRKVILYVDGYRRAEDFSEPYELFWNTTGYEDYSYHTIVVRAIDNSSNKTDSEPIILVVDNTLAYPTPVEIESVSYHDNTFVVTWFSSRDADFYKYTLYEDLSRTMTNRTDIFSSTNVYDTVHVVDNISEGERRYYQVVVTDSIGLESESQVYMGTSLDVFAYYPFDGNARDMSGNNLHGSVRGARLTEDRFGNANSAYDFDGSYDMIDLRMHGEFRIAGDLTISLWMNAHPFDEGNVGIVNCQAWNSEEPEGNALYSITFYDSVGQIVYTHESGFGDNHIHEFFDYTFNAGEWYHIAIVRDTAAKTVDLYVNGSYVSTYDYTENPDGGALSCLAIGENQGTVKSERFFDGVLDEIYIFKRALSASEIGDLYNQP